MLKHIHDPKFRGMIIRRTTPMITKPGAVWDTAYQMYKDVSPKVKAGTKALKFEFPSGAVVQCGHCEHAKNKFDYQGSQVSLFLLDEAQQQLEEVVVYFISRMRTDADMKPQMKMTCNPEYSSFLRVWLQDAGYLDENNFGIPKPEMDGKVKYFIRIGNDMIWSDTEQYLFDTYGKDCGPMSFQFISAKCTDNPVLLSRDKSYLSKLKALPRIERMRLLDGAWLVTESSSGYFKKEWVTIVTENQLPQFKKLVRAYDLAGSLPSEKYVDPDYTVGVLGGCDSEGNIYILDMVRYRQRAAKVIENIIETAKKDGEDVIIAVPEDAGQAAKSAADAMCGKITAEGFRVRKKKVSNIKNRKVKMFEPFSVTAENEMVYVLKGDWNEAFFEELQRFDGSRNSGHDDIVDAVADLYDELVNRKVHKAIPFSSIDSPTMKAQMGL
jgi:predicted phage terminase large subunit-like protein